MFPIYAWEGNVSNLMYPWHSSNCDVGDFTVFHNFPIDFTVCCDMEDVTVWVIWGIFFKNRTPFSVEVIYFPFDGWRPPLVVKTAPKTYLEELEGKGL